LKQYGDNYIFWVDYPFKMGPQKHISSCLLYHFEKQPSSQVTYNDVRKDLKCNNP